MIKPPVREILKQLGWWSLNTIVLVAGICTLGYALLYWGFFPVWFSFALIISGLASSIGAGFLLIVGLGPSKINN